MSRWEFVKKHWIMFVVGVLIMLVAAATITWAVVTRHGDTGFMKTGGNEIGWQTSMVPIICFHDLEKDQTRDGRLWIGLYDAARKELAIAVGRELFEPCLPWQLDDMPTYAVSGQLLLTVSPSDNDDHGGGTTTLKLSDSGRILGAAVRFSPRTDPALRYRVMIHELCHVLGLDHDRLQDSIMFKSAMARPGRLSRTDIAHLKRRYLR